MTTQPGRYQRRVTEVEAALFEGGADAAGSIIRWICDNGGSASYNTVGGDETTGVISVTTPSGRMSAYPGDYILMKDQGGFQIWKPKTFDSTFTPAPSFKLSDANRMLVYRAYDDGDGNTVAIQPSSTPGYFVGVYDDTVVMSGIEIDGKLYSICPQSGGGSVSVLIGDEIVQNGIGSIFDSWVEAYTYVKGLTARTND